MIDLDIEPKKYPYVGEAGLRQRNVQESKSMADIASVGPMSIS